MGDEAAGDMMLEMLADGVPVEEILRDFPLLEAADVTASLLYAARRTAHSRVAA